ncbi:MAG: L-seryl-tRNA(Sec) selenium transferase [Chloroflexi bacterium]|nr:L-seryl-tRNA(Sec) selenium transferase [Chloroflexota bacterium]MYK60756.1 L-seryl-tRNA(Sec) selenium transferase [Chloroflexota bacterium]
MSDPSLVEVSGLYPRTFIVDEARRTLTAIRASIGNDRAASVDLTSGVIAKSIVDSVASRWGLSPTRVINATGVILHTNLGRAPLSEDAANAARRAALGYSDLEYDIETAGRGSRHAHVSSLLSTVTGAQAGIAVNNNAAAALLALSTLAGHGGDVIVSRSEAVEIGGGFRVPDVMAQSGAKLVDVGTTNRTYARDYESAIGPNTAAILKVHRSNFAISGFVHEDPLTDIVAVAKRHNIPLIHDLGSGCLVDMSVYGVKHEPTVQESINAGAHLTLFSGDKLLGGPQAGIVVGEAELVGRVSRHPLARAVRIDKMTLAALNATLRSYVRGVATDELPTLRMMAVTLDELDDVAKQWSLEIESEVSDGRTAIGGGSAPGQTLPTRRLMISAEILAETIAEQMRSHSPPVIGRIEDERFYIDPRTVLPEERGIVTEALASIAKSAKLRES